MRDPFTRSSEYAAAIEGATFSPTDAIRSSVTGSDAAPLDPNASEETRRRFIQRTMRAAAPVALAFTRGESVTVTTVASLADDKGTLVLNPDTIARLGRISAQRATDYASGRMLTQASAFTQFRKPEIQEIRRRARSRSALDSLPARCRRGRVNIAGEDTTEQQIHANYAAAHLAAGVAALRGREKVLKEWPGWAGYFAAAEQGSEGPGALADYITDPEQPAILRASASVLARLQGLGLAEDPDLRAAIDAGEAIARQPKRWRSTAMVESGDAVVAALRDALPQQPEQPEGEHQGEGGNDQGEDQDEGSGEKPPASTAIPGSEADEARGNCESSTVTHEVEEQIHAASPQRDTEQPLGASFKEERHAVHPCTYTLRDMTQRAAPLMAALRRVVWETITPPQFDRAQVAGDLDEGALHRLAAWGDPEVFEQRQETGAGRIAVALLVDCSGSMRGQQIAEARSIAYALAKTFGECNRYTLRIVGHDVQYGPQRLRLWDCPTADSISGLEARGDNADGFAIAATMRDIERVDASRRVVILMADGEPNAHHYHGTSAAQHIRSVIENGARRGTEFLALGIADGIGQRVGARMFGASRFVRLPDTRSAGPLLGRVLAKMGKEATSCA